LYAQENKKSKPPPPPIVYEYDAVHR
jgi:hypothetical protein